ncbi:MAG: T9SS type A sorting domain-containing protein [Taibaiella sp.]|jgi:uncharacterized repeat protein (TIGR01451 family)
MTTKATFNLLRQALFLLCPVLLLCGFGARAQLSSNVTITPQATPTNLTPCSGQGTFVVRVSNISATAITGLTFRDSMPPGINYVVGSVSGTGVTFGTTVSPNVVTFNIANIPSSGFVDVTFNAAVSCSVSTNSANIKNTYNVGWGTFFTSPYVTPTYPLSFPSLSISVDSPAVTAFCYTPFVRKITICNGGFGSVDSVTLGDVEGNTSVVVVGFSKGTVTGANTNNAKTVLKAADFATIGNMDGKLDQNECIVVYDTQKVVGSVSPITGTIRADWGCNTNTCTNSATSNVFAINTVTSSTVAPVLSRTLTTLNNGTDSFGNIYGRPITYREVVRNTSSVVAVGAQTYLAVVGLKYLVTDSIWASKNGAPRYHPAYYVNYGNNPYGFSGTPALQMGNVLAPATYTGHDQPNNTFLSLGDLNPGDSVVVTFEVRTAGPVTRVSDLYIGCGSSYNGNCYNANDGPSISAAVDAATIWGGCPAGFYPGAAMGFSQNVYNGQSATPVSEPNAASGGLHLARFRGFSFVDSSAILSNSTACKQYYDVDTVKLLMTAGVMDLPFYTDKSKFVIKLYTNGGIKWDGNLSKVYGRLSSWSNTNWQASQVVDNTTTDSTILVVFKRDNCPVAVLSTFASDPYNSYRGGQFRLNMQFVNTCPGSSQKQIYMTRIYDIDTTNTEPAIEAGPTTYKASWYSSCGTACADGLQIINYSHARTTLGQPDNNNDGIADTSGALDMTRVKTNLITWGDTLQLKYKMVVKTTQAGGVPYMYLKSTVDYTPNPADITNGTIANNFLKKIAPQVKLTRPGVGTFTGTGSAAPVNIANTYLLNLSVQGSGGITLPGITAYQDGDTVEVTENLVYWTPHTGWVVTTWNFLHTPYTSTVANPSAAQQYKCDSITCANFQSIDMGYNATPSRLSATDCADSVVSRVSIVASTASANCGSTYFPGEVRNILTPTLFKMVIPSASNWSLQRINLTWAPKILGTGSCSNVINNQLLPVSLYNFSGDTLIMNLKQIVQFYGYDITVNNLYSRAIIDFSMKYTPPASEQGCAKDHVFPQSNFAMPVTFSANCPLDSTSIQNIAYSNTWLFLNRPMATNTVTLPASNVVTVTQPNVVIPVTYTKGGNSGTWVPNVFGNDFMAIPDRPGIFVDSVKDNVTGVRIMPVGNIYNVAYLAPGASRNYSVYTHINLCQNDTLFMYADRTPCSGLPTDWASYGCQANANKIGFRYLTAGGELQMQDSLYSTQKDLCTADTVQFNVFNSQTQDANTVKVSFTLPAAMELVPGQTQLRMGNGSFVTVTDPVLNAGVYSWTLPATDTLYKVSLAPANAMSLRCGVTTVCGYISGSQITSSIAGTVACGPITSLTNANPLPLNINGAPALSYFSNVQATVQPVTGCGPTSSYDYRIAMYISGGTTLTSDSVKVILPEAYSYVSYNPAAPGSVHAPPGAPSISTLGDGATQLTWKTTAGIVGGDSIIFTFKYEEVSEALNKCESSPARNSIVSTSINSSAFCAATGTSCGVGIGNGVDTVSMQSLKPSISTTTSTVVFGNAFGAPSPLTNSYLHIAGTLSNTGSAAVAPGTNIIMEPFMDLDNSGTITPGDYAFDPYVYSGGITIGGSVPYDYTDSIINSACPACGDKNVLLRFSNNPSLPLASSQCLCDSVIVAPAITNTIPLDLVLGALKCTLRACNQAMLTWNTYEETGTDLYFEIQAGTDGIAFHTIKVVTAKGIAGSSYEQIVDMLSEKTYFRLVMHTNGRKVYSKVLTIESDCWKKGAVTVYPNPFTNTVYIKGARKGSEIVLMDITGRTLLTQKANGNDRDLLHIDHYASGTYMIMVTDESGITTTIKLSKN